MTKVDNKLKSLGFNRYKEQKGDICYEKEILGNSKFKAGDYVIWKDLDNLKLNIKLIKYIKYSNLIKYWEKDNRARFLKRIKENKKLKNNKKITKTQKDNKIVDEFFK